MTATAKQARARGTGTGRKTLETLHAVASGLWLGAVVMAGATAGILFTTMRELEPAFGRFAGYDGDMSNIGAGFIQNRVFLALDVVQYASATLALASTIGLIVFCRLPIRRASSVIRLLALGGSMMLLSYHLFVLTPRMQTNASDYWTAAERGDNAAADAAHDAFNADHPAATRVLGGLAIGVFVLLASGAWSAAAAGDPVRPEETGPARKAGGLEEPQLVARGGRR